ncbi:MAG: 50S ribosomal protein L21 [Christensenellales bacterium]|jgi:large subunit ribosomal protein L21
MYAVIQTGGKQYKVQVGDNIYVEKLEVASGEDVSFDAMLFADDNGVKIGSPVVDGVKVTGKVIRQTKGEKILVYKYKAKKNYRRSQGHRQPYTQIEITAIG